MNFSSKAVRKVRSCLLSSCRKTHFPCKHILAVFSFFDKWSFNNLPNFYKNSVFITLDTGHFDQADPDEEPTLEPSSTDEGNDDYGQVCGAETTVPALSSNEDDAPAQSSGTSSWPKIDDNEQPLITQKLRKRLQ